MFSRDLGPGTAIVEIEIAAPVLDGLFGLAELFENSSEMKMDFGAIRVQVECNLECRLCPRQITDF